MHPIKSYRDLDVWKLGICLVRETYEATETFPDHEKYGLVSQMRRSAISVPSNVAEGFRRRQPRVFRQFLQIALGSLAELETQMIVGYELGFMSGQLKDRLLDVTDHISRMIANLEKRL